MFSSINHKVLWTSLRVKMAQARQGDLKLRHQTEEGTQASGETEQPQTRHWTAVGGRGVGGQVFIIHLLTAQEALITEEATQASENTHNIRSSQSINRDETQALGDTERLQTSRLKRSWWTKALITFGLLNLSTRKEHRPQPRQNNLKIRHHTEVAWEVGGPFFINCAQNALIPPGLIRLSTGKGHRPQARQNNLKIQHQAEVAWEVGGPFFINCAQNALVPPGLIKLSTGKGHRPQARQNDLKIRHQTEVAWEVGGPSIQ
ncbi:hypothetical protein B0H16DRAFT_1699489 [Mycena metata]|uniref:Uncharacterized protein n=1 Tax=Mycena metata TaxID=1033252 RepID=A0AAD7MKU3_9AGAR|nr:hypothetical protein B0H16DRAFT_1699489 [Mycena metata]